MRAFYNISILLGLFSVLFYYSCINAPKYSEIPEIEFISFSNLEMDQSPLNSDTTILSIGFTDGDGDIGFEMETTGENIFIIDNRTEEIFDRFRVPSIPPEGANNGVSGEINMVLLNTCCVFPPQDSIPNCESPMQYPTNDLTFTIYIVDRAGNKSNEIITPPITLNCN
ncbi:MAG: hypothetical protein P1U56_20090 [Saprospiraceae bacterium]|nr:hypothetical protein [Saprospiraceae bacterium]